MEKKKRGHAMVELVLGMGWLMILFQAVLVFCQLNVSRQRAFAAARLGTWLQASGVIAEETVNAEVGDYLTLLPPITRNPDWKMGRFMEIPGSNLFWFMKTDVSYALSHRLLRWLGLDGAVIHERVVAEKEDVS